MAELQSVMVRPEVGVDTGGAIPPPGARTPVESAIARRPTRATVAIGVSAMLLGTGAVLIGTIAMNDVTAVPRVVFVVLGLVSTFIGLDRLSRVLIGERFNLGLWLAMLWIVVLILAAITAPWLPLAESRDVSKTLLSPTLVRPDLFSSHPLGTDRQGLDILGGVIYGARVSLIVAVGGVALGTLVGGLIGLAAGWYRGKFDASVRFLTDSMLAFPPLILLLAMVAVLGASVLNVTIALALLGTPIYIRLSRVNTMVFAQREFVVASTVLGAKSRRIIFRELLPNVALPVLAYGFVVVGVLIVAEASLSFLGLSVSRPNPTWGNMIAAGQTDFQEHPHLVIAPGAVLFLTVFALNRIGDKARAMWSPVQRTL